MSINCFSLFLVVGVANSFFLVSHRKYISFGSSINLATFVFPFFIVQYRLYLSKNEHVYKSINSRIRFRYKISVGTVLDWERKKCPLKKKHEKWRNGINGNVIWSEVIWMEGILDNWTKCWEMGGEISGLESQSQVVFLTKIVRSRLSFFALDLTLSGVLIWNVSKKHKSSIFLDLERGYPTWPWTHEISYTIHLIFDCQDIVYLSFL